LVAWSDHPAVFIHVPRTGHLALQQPSLVALGVVAIAAGTASFYDPSLAYRLNPLFDSAERSDAGRTADRFGALFLAIVGVWAISFGW
jgi:hypothetical protein